MIDEGQPLYAVDGIPAVLLYGSTPAWRNLSQGDTGLDVAQLNADLVALGDATTAEINPGSDYFSAATGAAVKLLQADVGAPETGTLALGQAVFLPTAARITAVPAGLGAPAQREAHVLTATSTTREVTATIDASQMSRVEAGDPVTLTLPDGHTTPAVVASVGTVATSQPGENNTPGTSTPATVQVDITPTDPAATGTVDQVPVTVEVTTATVKHALAVPLTALTTTSDGHPAIDVTDAAGVSHRLRVGLGLLDDTAGLVQITGPGLSAGQIVSLP